MNIAIKDTTFRDGLQHGGIEATEIPEILKAIKAIDQLGVRYHEVGFAISSNGDQERIRAALELKLNGQVAAFGRTHPADVAALIDLDMPVGVLVGKTRSGDVLNALNISLDQNLLLIHDSVSALAKKNRIVIYDAEHAFQAFLEGNADYALRTLKTAINAGASYVVLCDTNGKMMPRQVAEVLQWVAEAGLRLEYLGVHMHNDRGRAVANAEAALECGIGLVEGTIGGFGERNGNMDLCTFIPNAHLDYGFEIVPERLEKLTRTYLLVCDVLNVVPAPDKPWVGSNAFYTEAGMHQSGHNRLPGSYFHANPALVGNHAGVGVTGNSGKANISSKALEFGLEIPAKQLNLIAKAHQTLVDNGGDFGLADASFYLWLLKQLDRIPKGLPEFVSFRAIVEKDKKSDVATEASLRLIIDGEPKLFNADGDGPINALDEVLRRTLRRRYPDLMHVKLDDFKVRIVDSGRGTAAKVRVRISFTDGEKSWTTMAVHENIIQASWEALWDGYIYKLIVNGNGQM